MPVRDIIPVFFEDGEDQDKIFYAPLVGDFEKRKIGELSMGERRYFELLLISNLDHPFLMLDEPFSMIVATRSGYCIHIFLQLTQKVLCLFFIMR